MSTLIGTNSLSARPSAVDADVTMASEAANACGFVVERFDASFEHAYPTTTTTDYTGIDVALEEAYAAGTRYIWFSIGPYPSTSDASWTALLGTYGAAARLVKKRPPAGTANAGWAKITECVNAYLAYVSTKWQALGGDPTKVYFSIFQEWNVGDVDGPSVDDLVTGGEGNAREDFIAEVGEGVVDVDADWDSMSGVNAGYANVRGCQNFAEYMYPLIVVPYGFTWVAPAMGNHEDAIATESSTYFGSGLTWWNSIIAGNKGKLHLDLHAYIGSETGRFDIEPVACAYRALKRYRDGRTLIRASAVTAGVDATKIVWHCSEFGYLPIWLFGTATPGQRWTQELWGTYLAALCDVFRHYSGCETACHEEIFTNPNGGTNGYGLINSDGFSSAAMSAIAVANGTPISVLSPPMPAWGGEWVTGTGVGVDLALSAEWPMEDATGTGAIVDTVGTNDLAAADTHTRVAGFDGFASVIGSLGLSVTTDDFNFITSPFSVAFWFKRSAGTDTLALQYDAGTGPAWLLQVNETAVNATLDGAGAGWGVQDTITLSSDTWHFLCMRFDATNVYINVNNRSEVSDSASSCGDQTGGALTIVPTGTITMCKLKIAPVCWSDEYVAALASNNAVVEAV